MAEGRRKPTQKTKPKKGKPIEIPIPTHEDVFAALRKVAPPGQTKGPPKRASR